MSLVRLPALALLLLACLPASAKDQAPQADALTVSLLQVAEFQRMAISPDGTKLAVARRDTTGRHPKTEVIVHRLSDLEPLIRFDPGVAGVIASLDWVGNQRLVVGATRMDLKFEVMATSPIMVIANLDGSKSIELPGRFFSTLEDDPDHILIRTCSRESRLGHCIPEIRKTDFEHLGSKKGELVLTGPEDTSLYTDAHGKAGLAFHVDEEDGTTQTHVYDSSSKTWRLINDSRETGLEVSPLSIRSDGSLALLQTERKEGPDLIETYNPLTGERKPLYADADSDPVIPVYSFDEQEVIGAYYEPTQPRLHLFQPSHPDAAIVTKLQAAFPGQVLVPLSRSADRNLLVLLAYTDRDPGAYYLFDHKAMKVSRITPKKPWIEPAKQAAQRGVAIAARDGERLHGLLTVPPGSDGKHLPLVVLPHGGPYGVVDHWGFDTELQILAQHGYAVLQVNFRGSGGYGRRFSRIGERQWGRKMQDDITDATRWAIAEGVADPARLCIYGASYGGYAALMGAIREPELYRCAIGVSGVFDLGKMYKWGDIRETDYGQKYLDRVLGKDKVELAANSPVSQVDKVRIPVLLMHGQLDGRVPIEHAIAMEKALRKADKPVELVRYPFTGHGILIDKYERDYYARILAFLDANIGASATTTAASASAAR